jgi:phosphate transport system protein
VHKEAAPVARDSFRDQLEALNRELHVMGVLVQQAISGAVTALVTRDVPAAQTVVERDTEVNQAYAKIERLCLELLALQQPMAGDLRRIAATLKVITDLERMADHAVVIARVVRRLGGQPHVKPLVDIPAMANLAQEMVADALVAFVQRDKARALAMIARDNELDGLHRKVIDDLQALMEKDPSTIAQGIQLLFVSGSLERIGDYATNLGEWLIYLETGQKQELNQ